MDLGSIWLSKTRISELISTRIPFLVSVGEEDNPFSISKEKNLANEIVDVGVFRIRDQKL